MLLANHAPEGPIGYWPDADGPAGEAVVVATTKLAPAPSQGALHSFRGAGRRALWGGPALLAVIYLAVLAIDFHAVITAINTFGDAIIAPVLGKLAGQAPPGSQILLGHHAWYEEFLFLRATAGLPFYRGLWDVAPLLWTLAGFGVLGWAAWRALGTYSAFLTVPALICLGHLGRFSFFTFDWHGLSVFHTILVAAALVWLAPRAAGISWARLVLAAITLGLVSALPVASDQLFVVWALVPLCLTAALLAHRSEGRARWTLVAFALVTTVVAVSVGAGIVYLLRANGVGEVYFMHPLIASLREMRHNVKVLAEGFVALGGGYLNGVSLTPVGLAVFVSGLLILAALVVALAEGWRFAARRPAGADGQARSAGALGYVGFWLSSLILQMIVFVASGVPKVNANSSRYTLAGYIAIMALVPLLARRGPKGRMAATLAVCVLGASAVFQLVRQPSVMYAASPTAPVAQRLVAFARAHDVHYGYSGYWDAPDLTWLTNFGLPIYPIDSGCGRLGICRWGGARIETWYRNRPGTRSMMIADSIQHHVNKLDPRLGRPLATARIGTLTVAVYRFDLARDMPRR